MTLTTLRRPEHAEDLMMLPADLQDVNIDYFSGNTQPHCLTPVEAPAPQDASARFNVNHSITNLDDSRLEPVPVIELMSSERHDHWSSIYGSPFSAPDPYAHLPASCSDLFRYGDAWSSHQPATAPLAWPSCSETPPPQPSRTIACHSDASAFVPRPTTVWSDVSASLTTERQDGALPHQTADVVAASPQAFWPPPAPPVGALRDPRETSPAFFPGQARAPPLTLQQEGNVRAGARGIRAPFSTTGEPSATGGRRRNRRQKGQPKIGKLWQFLLSLLHDQTHNPSMIKWDDFEQGRFKFVQSEAVARLWGSRKGYETNMTYEKLSRAMRYYYKPGILEPVVGRRLVYAFGPNADWKTPPDVSLH